MLTFYIFWLLPRCMECDFAPKGAEVFFKKDSTTMRDTAFSHGSHLWKRNWWDLHENYSADVL